MIAIPRGTIGISLCMFEFMEFKQALGFPLPAMEQLVVESVGFTSVNGLALSFAQRTELTSNLVFSAIILWNPIPTPSMTANKQAQPIAEFLAAFNPPLTARAPPVKNPAITI